MYGAVQGIKGSVSYHGQVEEHRLPSAYHDFAVFYVQHIRRHQFPFLKSKSLPEQGRGSLYLVRVHGFGEIAYIMAQHVGGILQYLKAEFLAAFLAGHAGHIGLAGCIGPGVKGGHVRVLGGYDVDLVKGYAGCLGSHLGEYGVGSLADLRGAHAQLHGAVLVEYHAGGSCFQGDGVHACLITKDSHAHTLSDRAGLIPVGAPLLVPADVPASFLDAFLQTVGMEGDAVGRIHETVLHAVLQPEFTGVHANGVCQVIGETFRKPCCLGNAVGPHGAGCGRGGVYGEAVHLGAKLISVKILEHIAAVGADGMAVGGVGAVVGIGIQLPGKNTSVLCHQAFTFSLDGVAGAGAGDGFLPADFQPDRPSPHGHGQECV